MVRRNRWRIGVYGTCALILSLALGAEASVIIRHSAYPDDSPRGRVYGEANRDARPLPLTVRPHTTSHIDRRLSSVATRLGHGRAEVRCWSSSEWATLVDELGQGTEVNAYTTIDRRQVHFPWQTCNWLRVAGVRTFVRLGRAEALAAFAHELEHLRGIEDEARAECYSHQNLSVVAQALGSTRMEAERLRLVAWTEFYPPPDSDYLSAECRNGGRFDLHPSRRRWP
jgi:hypothetical protein